MATKDYVRRPQKRKPKKAEKPQTPWLRIILALAIIVGFFYGLYMLQQNAQSSDDSSEGNSSADDSSLSDAGISQKPNNTTNTRTPELESVSNSAQTQVNKPVAEPLGKSPEELPPLPKLEPEDWAYIDSLPEFSVEVDATGPIESDREYIMQCGSFRTTERAHELKATIAFQGFESRIIDSENNSGQWFRVVLGPYDSKRDAEKDRHTLRRANVNGCKIW